MSNFKVGTFYPQYVVPQQIITFYLSGHPKKSAMNKKVRTASLVL